MTNLKITIPSDDAILGYDEKSLQNNIAQHLENINVFQQHISDEHSRIAVLESIIKRKRELERANSGVQQN